MTDQPEQTSIPQWVVNQIGRLSMEIEYLRNENAALRSALAKSQEEPS